MSSLLSQIAVAGVAILVYEIGKRFLLSRTEYPQLPKPPGSDWLWGHERVAWETTDSRFYRENHEKYGKVFVMDAAFFQKEVLAVVDPAAIAHIFTRFPYRYPKSPTIRPLLERLLGRSLVWAEGEDHRKQRSVIGPCFNFDNVRLMDPEVRDTSDRAAEALRAHAEKEGINGEIQVNALNWSRPATLDIIGRVAFGYNVELASIPETKDIMAAFREVVTLGMSLPGFAAPLAIRALPFITSLPFKVIQKQGDIRLIIRHLGRKVIRERKVLEAGGMMRGKDLLSVLFNMYQEDVNADESKWDDILDQITTFVIAGHEATAYSIGFAMYELSRHKDIQDRVRKELLAFESKSGGGEPTFDEYWSQLPELDAVCKAILARYSPLVHCTYDMLTHWTIQEIMRLYGITGHTERVAIEDDILPLSSPIKDPSTGKEINSIKVTEGQVFHFSHRSVNRSHTVWGPDGDEFKPERWYAGIPGDGIARVPASPLPPATELTKGWNGLMSFIEGPRMCLGWRLGVMEFKYILSAMMRVVEFLPVEGPNGEIEVIWATAMQPFVKGQKDKGVNIPVIIKPFKA